MVDLSKNNTETDLGKLAEGGMTRFEVKKIENLHYCTKPNESIENRYGFAVTLCFETKDGRLWGDNEEYCNQVNYCPFCGYPAKRSIGSD